MTPEWRCSKCGHEWGGKPESSGSSRSSFDRSPTTWSLVVDAPLICRRRVYGQGGNADAWAAPGGVGRRFWHFYSWSGSCRRIALDKLQTLASHAGTTRGDPVESAVTPAIAETEDVRGLPSLPMGRRSTV